MEAITPGPIFTPENWQLLVLETAEYDRPPTSNILADLTQKLVSEWIELFNPTPSEKARGQELGRIAVLSPASHARFFPDAPFEELKNSPEMQKHVAGEFGDILWYQVALLADSGISMEETMANFFDRIPESDQVRIGLEYFNSLASSHMPNAHRQPQEFDENPIVIYGGMYVSRFVEAISPVSGRSEGSRSEKVESAANLLWATTYLLTNYCHTNLQEVLQGTYNKLKQRKAHGIPQGQGIGDDRWRTS